MTTNNKAVEHGHMEKTSIEITKSGLPAAWEKGGGMSNTGYAQIIAGPNGQPKKPVYIRRRGSLANGDHALFIVAPGDIIVQASHHRKDFDIGVYRIVKIDLEERVAFIDMLISFGMGEWDGDPAPFQAAIDAAMEKATCYHCRSPHYIVKTEE